jgi:ABC-type transporter Mla subunit MlaD
MSEPDPIEGATLRLVQALEALEAAAERRVEVDRGQGQLVDQLHALGNDRARLASELDDAAARARALEDTNRDVVERIDRAIESIRGVLSPEA